MAERPAGSGDRAPIRLLWLIDSLGAGGAEALTVRFARAVQEDPRFRLTVAYLERRGDGLYERGLRALGVEPVCLEARHLRDLRAFRRLLRLMREEAIDVLHAHLAYASIWGVPIGRWLGKPVVASLHVGPSGAPGWSREGMRQRLLARLLAGRGVQPVAVSRAVASAWERESSIPAGAIRVIPNGAETVPRPSEPERRALRRRWCEELDLDPDPHGETVLAASVAVLRWGKGLDLLLDAAPQVLETRPEVRFVIAGDGPERDALESRVSELELDGRVAFAGFRNDVHDLLAAADFLVLPSREDAFPTVLLEAAAAGLPVAAAEVGGVGEIVVAGKTGLLVPAEDPAALAEAVVGLASRPDERRRLGEAARQRAEAELSVSRWLDRLDAVYRGAAPPRLTVVEPIGRGGLIHYAFQLCRALAEERVEVTLVTSRRFELEELPASFPIVRLLRLWDAKPVRDRLPAVLRPLRRLGRAWIWYREWLRLLGHLRRSRPDAVLLGDVRFPGDVVPLGLLAWVLRDAVWIDLCHNVRRFALAGRGAGGFRGGGVSRALYRRIYRLFDRILVHYESNRRRFLDLYGLPPERVTAIPHGDEGLFHELADPACTGAVLRQRLGFSPAAPVVLLFGSLARYKGADLLIEAFAEVHRRHPDARLVLAGPPVAGLDPGDLEREAEGRGLAEAVHVEARYVPAGEVAAWMELAAVAVFPYREISQSGALALALTFGLPVVATRVGAMGEMVHDGETGLLVEPEDAEALTAAVLELLEDPESAARLGREAAARVREEMSWRRVARTVVAEVMAVRVGAVREDAG